MDFTETTVRGELDGAAVLDAAIDARRADAADLNKSLYALKRRVRDSQRQMAAAFLKLASTIDQVKEHVPATQLRTFLASECGINRADIGTYLKFSETFGEHQEVVTERALPFSVVKALVAASPRVRAFAINRAESGSILHTSDIAAIRRQFAEAAQDRQVEQERRRQKVLRKAAERKAKSTVKAFGEEFLPFAQTLIDFYNDEPVQLSLAEQAELVKQEAGRCLRRFEDLFDTTGFPPAWEYYYHGNPDEAVRLARAHDSLQCLAAGRFQEWDHESGTPYDTSHDYLDRTIVESIIWLFDDNGISEDQLKRRRIPATVADTIAPPRHLTSIEICAGGGGQAIGLHAAGFQALGLYERNKNAVRTLRSNYPLGPVHGDDIRQVDFSPYRGKVDLVAGGVPCQGHSSIGKQRGRDDERDLFLETVRIVEEVEPRAFFFENVEGFNFEKNTAYRAELHEKFAALGYESQVFSFLGSDYGLAQDRPRVAFVGFKDGRMSQFRMPPVFDEWRTTVGKTLLDLVAANGWGGAKAWAENKANKIGPTIVGGSEKSGRLAFSSNLRRHVWEEMGIDPMGIAEDAPSRDHPDGEMFQFTMQMGARLQGFPDDWEFSGAVQERKRQIANALPPIMARVVGLAIYSALTGVKFDYERALKQPFFSRNPTGLARLTMMTPRADLQEALSEA